jgi:hypothetical protein
MPLPGDPVTRRRGYQALSSFSGKTAFNGPYGPGKITLNFVLPKTYDGPSLLPESLDDLKVTFLVFVEFVGPEFRVGFRFDCMFRASMPEASVNEDSQARGWENYIRTSGQITTVKAESQSFPM